MGGCGLCLTSRCVLTFHTGYLHTQELRLTLRPTPLTATGGDATWHFAVRRNIAQIFDDDTCRAAAYRLPPAHCHAPHSFHTRVLLLQLCLTLWQATEREKRRNRKTQCGKCDESFEKFRVQLLVQLSGVGRAEGEGGVAGKEYYLWYAK